MIRRRIRNAFLILVGALAASACGGGPESTRIPELGPPPVVPASRVAFPLRSAPSMRYLADADGTPFFIRGRTAWDIRSVPVARYAMFLDDTRAKGFNAIEMRALSHDATSAATNRAGNGTVAFVSTLGGRPWSGTLAYGNVASDSPDFTRPNEEYWAFLDGLLTACESRGIAVLLFPAYVGYAGGNAGWMREMVANGPARMKAYGAWIASRYAARPNIIWMLGGDYSGFDAAERDVERALIDGLRSVPNQTSTLYSAEWKSGDAAREHPDFGSQVNLNGIYSWEGHVGSEGRIGYGSTPIMPSFLLEEPYDEEGRDGTSFNPSATQPVRRFVYWGWLTTIGGYVAGNGYVYPFYPGWESHLKTAGTYDLARLNAVVQTLEWWRLVPDGLAGIGRLVTTGGGTADADDFVAAAATPAGDLLIAYVGPGHAGSVSVDMTKLRGTVTARWFDPTKGIYSAIGTFPNTGNRAFTVPAVNGAGASDWVLRLDANQLEVICEAC